MLGQLHLVFSTKAARAGGLSFWVYMPIAGLAV